MRIGFIGNQNNFPFMLARALGRLGHEIRMVVDQEHPLDRPEHRYTDVPYPYPDWIREIPTVQMEDVVFNTARWRSALNAVCDCDALVLNKFGYDAANRLPLPAFCLTTGGDVEFFANPRAAEALACHVDEYRRPRRWVRTAMHMDRLDWTGVREVLNQAPRPLYRAAHKQLFRAFVRRQQDGLRRSVGISGLPDGISQAMTDVMKACRLPGVPRLHLLMADVDWIRPLPAPENPVMRVFNSARILWKLPFPPLIGEWENKGTDVLLKGVSMWHRRTGQSIDVRLVEKGQSADATKDLVRELGIQHLVHWQPELTQAEVFEEYARADIVADQCGCHVVSMGGFEAMAAGRPVIANGRPDLYSTFPSGPPPVAQAAAPEEVAAQLDRLGDPAERARLAVEGRRFVERHVSADEAARQVAAILGAHVAQTSASAMHS